MSEHAFPPPAIVILGHSSLETAKQLKTAYPTAEIYGLRGRAEGCDQAYEHFGDTLRSLYQHNRPLIVLCATGIIIRTLAPVLSEKGAEPPVLAVAEDGSAVVPLLGGLSGVNQMARELGQCLGVAPAITTSGELRFGTCILNPPTGYALADIQQGKRWVSDLLGGAQLQIEGEAPWLASADLPLDEQATRRLCVTPSTRAAQDPHALLIHPKVLLAYFHSLPQDPQGLLRQALQDTELAQQALNAVLLPSHLSNTAEALALAESVQTPLRFVDEKSVPADRLYQSPELSLYATQTPEQAQAVGRPQGQLSVVGLGPGDAQFMAPAVRQALNEAQDILGYETYVKMAGPFHSGQTLHPSDNREELQRAAHAFELAAQGRRVVMVSSGDPGVFAMAAAVLEALEEADNPRWNQVQLNILPGISAAMATAAKAGAPLGHDFCLLSLSDNLKPWSIIERRLIHAAASDLVMAFYNPISKARPWQLAHALSILRQHKAPETLVVLGRDIGRPKEQLKTLTLGELTPDQVDMRTLVIIGSSTSRRFTAGTQEWVYTPRWYPDAQP